MADVYWDVCKEYDNLIPATIAFCIQREDDPNPTPQYVRCCDRHEGQAAVAVALMRRRMAPAAVFRQSLKEDAERDSAS
jgi:hypothetical protein